MLTVPVPLILFDICLLKFTNKSIKYIRFFITLPHINAEVTMNKKLKSLLQQLLQSPRRFPVELALGVVFFIIAVWDSESREWSEKAGEFVSAVNGDILWFFVPLMALTFWLHQTVGQPLVCGSCPACGHADVLRTAYLRHPPYGSNGHHGIVFLHLWH